MSSILKHAEKLESLRVLSASEGFREAAKRLGIAPSTLSERIDTLEQVFRRPLVERSSDGPTLTPFARGLVESAAPALDALDALVPQKGSASRLRVLRVGAYESLALRSLTRAIVAERDALPPAIEIASGRASALVRALFAGQLDAVVVAGPIDDERVDVFALGAEHLVVVRPRTMADEAARLSLRSGAWVGLARAPDARRGYATRFLDAVEAAKPRFACDSFEVAARLSIEAGLPAVLPGRVARDFSTDLTTVAFGPSADEEGRHPIVLVVKRGLIGPPHKALRDALRKALDA